MARARTCPTSSTCSANCAAPSKAAEAGSGAARAAVRRCASTSPAAPRGPAARPAPPACVCAAPMSRCGVQGRGRAARAAAAAGRQRWGPIDTARARGQLELLRRRCRRCGRSAASTRAVPAGHAHGRGPARLPGPGGRMRQPAARGRSAAVGRWCSPVASPARRAPRPSATSRPPPPASAWRRPGFTQGRAGPVGRLGRLHGPVRQPRVVQLQLGPLISWTLPANGVARARIAQAETAATRQGGFARFDATAALTAACAMVETALESSPANWTGMPRAWRPRATRVPVVAGAGTRALRQRQDRATRRARRSAHAGGQQAALAASEPSSPTTSSPCSLALGGGWEGQGQRPALPRTAPWKWKNLQQLKVFGEVVARKELRARGHRVGRLEGQRRSQVGPARREERGRAAAELARRCSVTPTDAGQACSCSGWCRFFGLLQELSTELSDFAAHPRGRLRIRGAAACR